MTAADHHIQNALERFAVAHLQYLAEVRGVASSGTSADLHAEFVESLERNGHTTDSLSENRRHATYLSNAKAAASYLISRLEASYPQSRFSFRFTGTEGRLERRKGDFDVEVVGPDGDRSLLQVSFKNYEKGPERIQVGSGTFQSFALGFILPSVGVGTFLDPATGERARSNSKTFRQWRNDALCRNGWPQLVASFEAFDVLNDEMRAQFLDSDEFRFYDEEKVAAVRRRVGAAGVTHLHRILSTLPGPHVRRHVLKAIGFDGSEHLLVVGKGKVAETITDPAFRALIRRVRAADLRYRAEGQTLHLTFSDSDGDALSIQVPCTINTNGAWFRDGEPYEGTRYHPKEKRELAYGERRPRKSREIATSINTYVDLGATGVLRDLPAPGSGPA